MPTIEVQLYSSTAGDDLPKQKPDNSASPVRRVGYSKGHIKCI